MEANKSLNEKKIGKALTILKNAKLDSNVGNSKSLPNGECALTANGITIVDKVVKSLN